MNLNWLESIILGFVSGLAEFLPVSAEAHRIVLLKVFGGGSETALLRFFAHLGAVAALIVATRQHWGLLLRERAILHTPMRKRARQPNPQAITEWRIIFQIFACSLVGLLFYIRVSSMGDQLAKLCFLVAANGLLLFLPTRLVTGNKDYRTITPLDSVCVGLVGALGVLPGISPAGAVLSAFSARGIGRTYACGLCLLLLIPYLGVMTLLDVAGVLSAGVALLTVQALLRGVVSMFFSFAGAFLGIEILRRILIRVNLEKFSYYCFGLAMFCFVLYLTV